MTRIQLAQRNDGVVVRILAENHEIVMSTSSQLYADERDALIAIVLVANAFGVSLNPTPLPTAIEGEFELLGYDAGDVEVCRVPIERVDERTQAGGA